MSLLNQALPYVAAISPYQPGKPMTELAREMGKSFDDRKKIQKMQDENRNERERLKADFISNFHREPSGTDLLKYRLWKEQNCCDPYVQLPVGPGIFEPKYHSCPK